MRMRIGFGQISTTGKRGAARLWNVRVLRQKQRLEAPLLSRPRQLADVDAIVCRKIENANTHNRFSCPLLSEFEQHPQHNAALQCSLFKPAMHTGMPARTADLFLSLRRLRLRAKNRYYRA